MPVPRHPANQHGGRKIKNKKSSFNAGEVWWEAAGPLWLEALCDFRNELHEHVETAENDQLRFQTERLLRSLIKRIKVQATGMDEWRAMFACYQHVAVYGEAGRLHGEEIKARGLSSARTFCSSAVKQFERARILTTDFFERFLYELNFRFRSIASWIEAQESFSLWLVFKDLPQAWRGNMDERARAIQAWHLSQLPQRLLSKTKRRGREVIGTNYEGTPWNAGQWRYILEQAARLTEKENDCTPLEEWVWRCYPVFRRYRWNAREVLGAASNREIDFEKEKAGIDEPEKFQKYWIRRGLRFAGGKQKQNRTRPLAGFVEHVELH
jgi:hypothetical protein